jgi:hypothetical protein
MGLIFLPLRPVWDSAAFARVVAWGLNSASDPTSEDSVGQHSGLLHLVEHQLVNDLAGLAYPRVRKTVMNLRSLATGPDEPAVTQDGRVPGHASLGKAIHHNTLNNVRVRQRRGPLHK